MTSIDWGEPEIGGRSISVATHRAEGSAMRIEILCAGGEILTGNTLNMSYSQIAQRLAPTRG